MCAGKAITDKKILAKERLFSKTVVNQKASFEVKIEKTDCMVIVILTTPLKLCAITRDNTVRYY